MTVMRFLHYQKARELRQIQDGRKKNCASQVIGSTKSDTIVFSISMKYHQQKNYQRHRGYNTNFKVLLLFPYHLVSMRIYLWMAVGKRLMMVKKIVKIVSMGYWWKLGGA